MPTTTLLQLIIDSLESINAVPANQALSAQDAQKGLRQFNVLLGMLSAQGLTVPAVTIEGFSLVVGQASYTIGSAGNFNTSRPERITKAWVRDSGGTDYPVDIIGSDEYGDIAVKTTSGRPYYIWYNPTVTTGTIYTYPVPSATDTLYLVTEKPLTEITALTTNISLPNEYLLMLQSNLAILLSGPWTAQVPPSVALFAKTSLDTLLSKNLASRLEPVRFKGFMGNYSSSDYVEEY